MSPPELSPTEIEQYYRVRVPLLKLESHQREWRGPCPVHGGKNDSFAVNSTTGRAYCHSKCDRGWDLVGLEMALTSTDRNAALRQVSDIIGRNGTTPHRRRIVAEYDYTDESGELLFQVIRYHPKEFKQRRPDGNGGWIWDLKGVRRVLYRLPEVLKARTVFLFEGEKDVNTARAWGLRATTNPGGAKKWHPDYTASLMGKEVIVVPDQDQKGKAHAELVIAKLRQAGVLLRVITLPAGKDLTDWKEQHGGTIEKLRQLVGVTTNELTPSPTSDTPARQHQPTYVAGLPYCFHAGAIWGFRYVRDDNWAPIKLTNFEARIICDRIMDNGAEEETRWFTVSAILNGRTTIVEISARDFRSMSWVTEKLGGMAIVYSNKNEEARTAIQFLSGEIPTVRTFNHTGWRKIEGQQHYLHAGGAIGPSGNRKDLQVNLEGILPDYWLPDPPKGEQLVQAIRSSLAILDIAPDRITFPVLAAAYRAPLGECPFSVFIEGVSGQGKTELAALVQQHFGPKMHAQNLPASWDNTGLASAMLAFHAKDALLVVDDFVFSGNAARQQKLQAEADRLLRSQANASGRRRLTTEGTLRSSHPPRGLIVSTGEHTPRGKSLNARMVIIPFPKGAMKWSRLSERQAAAENGDFAAAMAAYVHWIASRLQSLKDRMRGDRLERRQAADINSPHMRSPENLAALWFGLKVFLEFARESNALYREEFKLYIERADAAFRDVAASEQGKHSLNDPARIFIAMVRAAIMMGRAHLRAPAGGAPEHAAPWGWDRAAKDYPTPQGSKIGWIKNLEVCLDPDASFQIAQKLAQERGEGLPGSLESIKRDLKEGGFVKFDKTRRTITIRRMFEGESHDVLCFAIETFQGGSSEPADEADDADNSLLYEVDSEG